MEVTFNPTSLGAFIAFFGPLVVGALTGLKTSGKIKAALGALMISAFAIFQAYLQGGINGDIFGSILAVIAVWQGSYAAIWKPLGLTAALQRKVPIAIGEPEQPALPPVDEMVDDDVPVQTDNSTKIDDGPQNVEQDPTLDLTEGPEIPDEVM